MERAGGGKISYIAFRKYQEDILADFERRRLSGERKFHYVSPPGSGKTLIGLELFLRLNNKALVLSPTLAIQEQWIGMGRQHTGGTSYSADPFSDADMVSLTYQSVSVKDGTALHRNAKKIIAALDQRKVVIFDECHHLTRFWADVVKALDTRDRYFIALTATLPTDRDKKETETYYKLLDTVDYEVLLPPVIREGYLAPYNDLVYTVSPTDTELKTIDRLSAPYRELMTELRTVRDVATPQSWAYDRLDSYSDSAGVPIPFDELYRQKPDYCIAAARFVLKHGMELPYSVIFTNEMEEAPNFEDVLLVMEDYIHSCLRKQEPGLAYAEKAVRAFRTLGYHIGEDGIKVIHRGIRDILSNSQGKLFALKPIIGTELPVMGDDFNCLVICDYEENKSGCGAREAFEYILHEPEIAPCRPVMLTGKRVLAAPAVTDDLMACAAVFLERETINLRLRAVPCGDAFEIFPENGTWNTRVSVPLVSYALERGIIRCLISTRSLLGEGWNAVRLNTLIDLTSVTGYAMVNQIRGRTLRLDDKRPFKTANNWDVVTLIQDPEQGAYDVTRLRQKFTRFFGLSSDGQIEKGIGHVHPLLARNTTEELYAARKDFNETMLRRATGRLEVYKKWNVHSPYKNTFIHCIDAKLSGNSEAGGTLAAEGTLRRLFLRTAGPAKAVSFTVPLLILAGAILGTGRLPVLFILACLLIPAAAAVLPAVLPPPVVFLRMRKNAAAGFLGTVPVLAGLITETLVSLNLAEKDKTAGRDGIKIVPRENNTYRIYSGDEILSPLLSDALNDIFKPIGNQKYFLSVQKYQPLRYPAVSFLWNQFYRGISKRKNLKPGEYYFWFRQACVAWNGISRIKLLPERVLVPVPEIFSRRKKDAEKFRALWQEEIGSAKLVASRGNSRQEIAGFAGKKLFPVTITRKELWI
ncbi:DEAD/DEAH box helicase family protein [Breznakiella homolactica]|uniref:DEAD/DEAH box helicase family protein n=1 Tax=Breznakiella homolactica TaxID=2798577 RepID=A0A7T7XMB6_9SPIR|nr:DEAD/DEAH box helicase family protein [Breznakiella homolactica]QQO08907.1 DEAD/DEAH box helicase family protein [Breznakiella homolactica]